MCNTLMERLVKLNMKEMKILEVAINNVVLFTSIQKIIQKHSYKTDLLNASIK